MADFRKVFVLAALVLVLGLGSIASAQVTALTCTANASVPPTVRAEGNSELVGDIVIDCIGGPPTKAGVPVSQITFTVWLNTNITSRIYSTQFGTSSSLGLSEAIMIVDEPNTTTNTNPLVPCAGQLTQTPSSSFSVTTLGQGCPFVGASADGINPAYAAYGSSFTIGTTSYSRSNVYRGVVTGPNQVQFIGVPVDAPGSAGHRIFRITNVRANAAGISSGSAGTPGIVQALISATGSTALPISNPTQVVGFVQQGMNFRLGKRNDITSAPNSGTNIANPQCNGVSRTTTNNNAQQLLVFSEAFPSSFKTRGTYATSVQGVGAALASQNIPGQVFNTESGFYAIGGIGSYDANVGLADYGTRLKAVFNNIPAGVSVYVSTVNVGAIQNNVTVFPGASAVLLSSAGIGAAAQTAQFQDMVCYYCPGGTMNGTNGSAVQLQPVNGSATAIWEVTGSNPLQAQDYAFQVWFGYKAEPGSNSPAPGTATVTGGFSPTPTDLGASASDAAKASLTLGVPRFVEGNQTKSALTIYTCRTNLLFPFVTNQAGFDTGLAIANTSQDPFGTTIQNGSCTLFSYGDNAPASIPTGPINAGKVYVTLASTAMPNFQGYIIAQCAFQYAHGFAFVSDFGARNLAMGYLALIIPEPGVGDRSAGSGGEALNN